MRFNQPDAFLLPLLLPVFVIGLFPFLIFALVGFLGIAVLGVLLVSVSLGDELNATSLFAQRVITQDTVSGSERAGYRLDWRLTLRPAFLMRVVGTALAIIGFGGFFLFQR
jgi:hypothetical protein